MPDCNYCGEDAGFLPYKCKFCGMTFCNAHRIPENHKCAFDLLPKSGIDKSIDLFYKDAFDYIRNGLSVAKIYQYVESKNLNRSKATELLESFIENSDDAEERANCILAFKGLKLNNDNAYSILENCLISDKNPEVRRMAAQILEYNFPKKSKSVLKWARDHDNELNY